MTDDSRQRRQRGARPDLAHKRVTPGYLVAALLGAALAYPAMRWLYGPIQDWPWRARGLGVFAILFAFAAMLVWTFVRGDSRRDRD
ncbi:MAG TPA: hypothetical protein VFF69_09460 [Phycisphaerales bacterium]|nr:hypothetical protein [Phycisphaerales bacterium]